MRHLPLITCALALAVFAPAKLRAQQPGDSPAATPVIEFHSGFWINLHHFLYQQARLRDDAAEFTGRGAQSLKEYSSAPPAGDLSPAEEKAWNAALDIYSRDWASRDLLRNSDMVIVNNRLAELENCADISPKAPPACAASLRVELVTALTQAAPVYRAHWWPQQDGENRAWMAAVTPLIHTMGSNLASRLASVYQHDWPPGHMRVDVVWYAGPEGSYTTLDPAHITIASHDTRNQGMAAFEMLFHEASHTLAAGVSQSIERHCRDLGKPIPRDLWHALLFYTTGELVRREVANLPQPASAYTPYAVKNGLYDHGWNDYEPALERYWQPYLNGSVDFDTAIAHVINAL
jgi:hypothetical protein